MGKVGSLQDGKFGKMEDGKIGKVESLERWEDGFVKQGLLSSFRDSPAFPPNPLAPALRVFRTIRFILRRVLRLNKVGIPSFELNLSITGQPLNEPNKAVG